MAQGGKLGWASLNLRGLFSRAALLWTDLLRLAAGALLCQSHLTSSAHSFTPIDQVHDICDNPAFMAALEAAWPCVKTACGVLKVSFEQLVITMRDVSGISDLHGTPCSTQPVLLVCWLAHSSVKPA